MHVHFVPEQMRVESVRHQRLQKKWQSDANELTDKV